MVLADRLLERATALKMSQAELARRVGLTQPTINALFTGTTRTSTKLTAIARTLRTTVEYLEGLTDDPTEEFSGDYLTEEEREWVELFRGLSEEDRAPLIAMARSLAK